MTVLNKLERSYMSIIKTKHKKSLFDNSIITLGILVASYVNTDIIIYIIVLNKNIGKIQIFN